MLPLCPLATRNGVRAEQLELAHCVLEASTELLAIMSGTKVTMSTRAQLGFEGLLGAGN